MKKISFAALTAVLFIGCSDGFYNASKEVYIAGKKVVVSNWDTLPEDVKEKLKKLDKAAVTYDKARSIIKPAIEDAKKKLDVSSEMKTKK